MAKGRDRLSMDLSSHWSINLHSLPYSQVPGSNVEPGFRSRLHSTESGLEKMAPFVPDFMAKSSTNTMTEMEP